MKKIFTLLMMTLLTTVGAWADDTYVVAGVTPLCGSFWDGSDAANQMTTTDNVNYKLVKEGLTLEKGTNYEFKVVKNGNVWIPDGGNVILTVEENGIYTVTFSYSTETQTPSAEAVKTGEAVIADKDWTVAGSSEALFGTAWAPTNTDNDMTKQDDGTYKLEKKGVTLSQGAIEYKICANHGWDESYGNNGGNVSFTIDEDGVYDVTFTFNPETKEIGAAVSKAESTGIGLLHAITLDKPVYNLAGQRVRNAKGIVIQNGKKYIVK